MRKALEKLSFNMKFSIDNNVKVILIQILLLILVSISFYFWKGLPLVIIFAVLWIDKAVLSHLKIHGEFGIELFTIPVILSGIIYGPLFGFFFGFLIFSLVGGLIEMISWFISQPFEVGWPPIIPSPESFIIGLMGLVSGLLNGLPFILIVLVAVVMRNILAPIWQRITTDEPIRMAYALNVMYNLALAFVIGDYLLGIFTQGF